MIVWLNGAFGVGKTSAARELVDLIPASTLYDPELIGHGLRRLLPEKRYGEVSDFQDLPSWRRLVVDTAAALLMEVDGPLVAPMTLLRQEHRDEIFGGLAARGIPVRHVLLHADETILRRRIQERETVPGDPEMIALDRQWCLDHLPAYLAALPWLTRDAHVLDTGALTHSHPTGFLAAGAFAVIVRELLNGNELLTAIEAARESLRTWPNQAEVTELYEHIDLAVRLGSGQRNWTGRRQEPVRLTPEAIASELGGGWTAEDALAIALYSALVATDFEDGVCLAVNHSGDSDSTGAVAGNILGAMYGEQAIPTRWLNELELADVIGQIGDDALTEFGTTSRQSSQEWLRRFPPN